MTNFAVYALLKLFTLALLFACGGVFLAYLDRIIFPRVSFEEELSQGNRAVAIVVAAAILSWGLALALVLG